MKTYRNYKTGEWYYEGQPMTRKLDHGVFSGYPTVEQLTEWGFREWIAPPTPAPTPEQIKEQRKAEIKAELESMDYLTSKYIDGEDMSQYGDWQQHRRDLRAEYNSLCGVSNVEEEVPVL